MKKLAIAAVSLVAVSAFAAPGLPAPHAKEAVIAADESWQQAEEDGDSRFIEQLLLDGYRSIGSGGKTTLKRKSSRVPGSAGNLPSLQRWLRTGRRSIRAPRK